MAIDVVFSFLLRLILFTSNDSILILISLFFIVDTQSAYLKTFGDNDDEKGYHTSKKDKGRDGYKKHEEYHKKDSDSYGFEKHTEFGKGKKGGESGQRNYAISVFPRNLLMLINFSDRSSKGSQTAPSHASYKVVEDVDG